MTSRNTDIVSDYLTANRLMTLGTSYEDRPWSATVFFAYAKNLNLYFYSSEKTKHCINIKKNPNVSVVINNDWRDKNGKIKGLQAIGKASRVSDKDYDKHYPIYHSRFKWSDEFQSDHRLYKIKLAEIWYINENLFGHFHR